MFQTSAITNTSTVLELGCGVSGILALAVAPRVRRYMATDQEYVFKLLKQNLENNSPRSKAKIKAKSLVKGRAVAHTENTTRTSNIDVLALDWETSDLRSLPKGLGSLSQDLSVDLVLACDCIYNDALIEPFVRTCAELCRMSSNTPTLCVIAQQLRSHEVFEAWLTAFRRQFRVWRVTDELLSERLKGGNGFVVHVGVLRDGSG